MFPSKSVHYIRLNESSALQCVVFLDSKHRAWFNRRILLNVIEDVKRLYMPKLLAEMQHGREELDTYRNNGYQFAYYYKPTREKQGVIKKTRQVRYIPTSKRTVQQTTDEEDLFIDDDDLQYEQKPKPKVETSYKMLKLFAKTLHVIVQPDQATELQPSILPSPEPEIVQIEDNNQTNLSEVLQPSEDVKPDINELMIPNSQELPSSTQAALNDFNFDASSSLMLSQMLQNGQFGNRMVDNDDDNVYE
ncbi:hypothetical protein WALSEDRAFT_68540 [Wallemia mellicola CBS 633.66]|uniref:Uncharacterized protein n=1 Tax=Wallemia mellicola (strain ATCC MYA-4683 / CBS 633.66) TaxID=671144 RepID=I4YDL9_WALMC|nr:hypothetical protein WALSEDRAFT_68540 [Wallemia mellicola CBS 633.66]EIM22061.1 hypothetical protein WALSEDRAFT_68540 [Wallemia mellicola CBS 633.66]|eukprot:XP_006957865.1 hypothetical protein WALSEDRAFT_68540 [Wallemia mellicola CBS 633.66]